MSAALLNRIEQLEKKYEEMREYAHSRDLRIAKLEWVLNEALSGRPVVLPFVPGDVPVDFSGASSANSKVTGRLTRRRTL